MNNSREIDLAWAAGIFDGEGTIVAQRGQRRHYSLAIRVGMTHEATISHLADIFGVGTISTVQQKGKRRVWAWSAGCKKAGEVLEMMMPYLVTKREQAKYAMMIRATVQKSNYKLTEGIRLRREELWGKLRACR
jgi:hypothetical protein